MIKNNAEDRGQHIEDLRNAFEHRAAWMYLMYKEAKNRGSAMSLPMRLSENADVSMVRISILIQMTSVCSIKNLLMIM